MKRQTKTMIIVLFLVVVLFGSSFAFLLIGGLGQPAQPQQQQQQTLQQPESYVVEGRLEQSKASEYLSRGYSLAEFHYYAECCPDLQLFVEDMPANYDFQIIVQKIADSNYTWVQLESLRGSVAANITKIADTIEPLCAILLQPPTECALLAFQQRAQQSANITENAAANAAAEANQSAE